MLTWPQHSVCIVSFIRLKVVIEAEHSKDPSYDNPAIAKWSIVELNVAIICPCIVTLRPLTSRIWSHSTAALSPLGSSEGPVSGPDLTIGGLDTRKSRSSWFQSLSVPHKFHTTATTTTATTSDPAIVVDEETKTDDPRLRSDDVELGRMGSNGVSSTEC